MGRDEILDFLQAIDAVLDRECEIRRTTREGLLGGLLGLLAVLEGLGGDGGGAFGAELDPGLEGLLVLGNDGRGHLTVPRVGGLQDSYAMSTLNNVSQTIKISLKFRECNELPSLVCRNADHASFL